MTPSASFEKVTAAVIAEFYPDTADLWQEDYAELISQLKKGRDIRRHYQSGQDSGTGWGAAEVQHVVQMLTMAWGLYKIFDEVKGKFSRRSTPKEKLFQQINTSLQGAGVDGDKAALIAAKTLTEIERDASEQ